jgi:hypothetical protein
MSDAASGPDVAWIKTFEPVIERGRLVAFRVTTPRPVGK